MKLKMFAFFIFFGIFAFAKEDVILTAKAEGYVVNEIKAVISMGDNVAIILKSDIDKPNIIGQSRTLKDLILEKLMLFDAAKLKLDIPDIAVDKMIKGIQEYYKLSEENLKEFQTKEVREQLRKNAILENLLEFRVPSRRATVSKQAVEKFYKENPTVEKARLVLSIQTARSEDALEDFKAKLPEIRYDIKWGDVFEVAEAELGEDKKFLIGKNIGDVFVLGPATGGFDVVKIVDRIDEHVIPLYFDKEKTDLNKSLYSRLENEVRAKKYKEEYDNYIKSLFNKASIEFTHKADQKAVLGA